MSEDREVSLKFHIQCHRAAQITHIDKEEEEIDTGKDDVISESYRYS